MRAEMKTLGHVAEAKAAKGAKAVLAALMRARAAPRATAAAPARARCAADEGSSSEEESGAEQSEEDESEEEEELWAVEDVLDMREGPPRQFLVRWEGYPPGEADTWEPQSNLLP